MTYEDFYFKKKKFYKNYIYFNDKFSGIKNDKLSKNINIKEYNKVINPINVEFFEQKNDYNIYFFDNSNILPNYLNTNFTFENEIQLFVNKKMKAVQNTIFDKYQFDVNNFEDRKTFFSLPKDEKILNLNLTFSRPYFLENFAIKKNQFIF